MDLREFFEQNENAAIAFSGGVDSSYLLYAACRYADKVTAYYVKSQFQPSSELKDALRIASYCGADLKVIDMDILSFSDVRSNPDDRCYHCKKRIMSVIIGAAEKDGYNMVADGTNASDDTDDRPGYRALTELGVRSPLRECGITKTEVRRLAKEAGLDVWNKAAYACLATRIPSGTEITAADLERTEKAEEILHSMGFSDFRVRMRDGKALIQVKEAQYEKAVKTHAEIAEALAAMYDSIVIDENTR